MEVVVVELTVEPDCKSGWERENIFWNLDKNLIEMQCDWNIIDIKTQ